MSTTITVDAVLFDMDGTLVDSTPGLHKAWETFCRDYSLGDHLAVSAATHGRRLSDTLRELCHIDDEVELQREIDRFEDEVIRGGPVVLPGVIALINQLKSPTAPFSWTIVTSATPKYASRALERCGIPLPPAGYVTSIDVLRGKPHPDPFLAGAKKCGIDPTKCLVVEDVPSGLKSGHAAGARTLAVCTSTPRESILASDANPEFVVKDLSKVSAKWVGGRIEVTIDESME